jgi:hypothetical protein
MLNAERAAGSRERGFWSGVLLGAFQNWVRWGLFSRGIWGSARNFVFALLGACCRSLGFSRVDILGARAEIALGAPIFDPLSGSGARTGWECRGSDNAGGRGAREYWLGVHGKWTGGWGTGELNRREQRKRSSEGEWACFPCFFLLRFLRFLRYLRYLLLEIPGSQPLAYMHICLYILFRVLAHFYDCTERIAEVFLGGKEDLSQRRRGAEGDAKTKGKGGPRHPWLSFGLNG